MLKSEREDLRNSIEQDVNNFLDDGGEIEIFEDSENLISKTARPYTDNLHSIYYS